VVLIIGQLGNLVGVTPEAEGPLPTLADVLRHLGDVLGWDERMGRYADVSVHRRARITPGVLVYRLDDRLFFANAGYVTGRIHEAVNGNPTPVHWLVFDGEALSHIDATGAGALADLIRSFQADGGHVRVRPDQDAHARHPGGRRHRRAGGPRPPLPHRPGRRRGRLRLPRFTLRG
jgi:MFS superfamily sulfate permease-like transporter